MKYNRVYNFSAGPAMMPEPVLEEIRLSDVFGSVSGPETIRSCYVNSLVMERCDISRKP